MKKIQWTLEARCPVHGILDKGPNGSAYCPDCDDSAEDAEHYMPPSALEPVKAVEFVERPCPECQGEGFTVREGVESGHACDGTDECCALNCPVPVQVQFQEPCEFCLATGKVYAQNPAPAPSSDAVRLAATKALKKMMKLGIVELEDEMIALNKALAILDQAAKED